MAFDPVTEGIGAVREIGGALIKHFFPDPAQQAAAEQKMAELEKSGELQLIAGQLAINQEEAKSTNWFVAGWRPFVGWVCGFGLLYAAILDPMARFVATVILKYVGPFPVIDTTITMQVLFGMLGLGGMRMWEKIKGAEGNR
jgi:Holin of 3TMs, for gene-transfer release